MYKATILSSEKIVSLSELQRNPSKALNAGIVRIVKNGKAIGIYLSMEEFEDIIEELSPLKEDFEKRLAKADKESKSEKLIPLKEIL